MKGERRGLLAVQVMDLRKICLKKCFEKAVYHRDATKACLPNEYGIEHA